MLGNGGSCDVRYLAPITQAYYLIHYNKIFMNIYFTSDLHLNHSNICKGTSNWLDKSSCRDFETLDEMNNLILDNLNSTVKAYDDLYLIGDFCMGGHSKTPEWFSKINTKNIHFIKGNHDPNINKYRSLVNTLSTQYTTRYHDVLFNMSHFPMLSWEDMNKGSFMLHGHEHGGINDLNENMRRLDIGIDSAYKILGEYRPFSLEEVFGILLNRPITGIGHHKTLK